MQVDDEYTGVVIAKLNERKGMMTNMVPASEKGRTRIEIEAPTRGLLGYRNIFFTGAAPHLKACGHVLVKSRP